MLFAYRFSVFKVHITSCSHFQCQNLVAIETVGILFTELCGTKSKSLAYSAGSLYTYHM